MADPLSLIANIIQILGGIIATVVFVRKALQQARFRAKYKSKPKSIFNVARDRLSALADKILLNHEPVLLRINLMKKPRQRRQIGIGLKKCAPTLSPTSRNTDSISSQRMTEC